MSSPHSSRASSPMHSEFGGSNAAEPPISPIDIPAPDDVPSSMPSQEASQKASKKEPLFLCDEQQADVIDWLKDITNVCGNIGIQIRKTNCGVTRPRN